jgi:Flp pilus assembly pilin Flp
MSGRGVAEQGWDIAELGQGVVEYGLILALSALVAVVILVFFGGTLSAILEVIGETIEQAS